LVRSVHNEMELDKIEHRLPVEAYEGLFMYIAGSPIYEIINERELSDEPVDTNNFGKALEIAESQSRFVIVDTELELTQMLNAPLAKWRVFLHPSQRRLVEGKKNGPCRVLGGAGTGKTVVAMHRAKWLVENHPVTIGKVLFTTFTKNLTTDIEANLATICSPDIRDRIEVINLDQWVRSYLRKNDYQYQILYSSGTDELWSKAIEKMPKELSLPNSFFKEEWQRVLQPQDVNSKDSYVKASRIGRGTKLNRADRLKIWPVFEEYRAQLDSNQYREIDDAYRDAAILLLENKNSYPYFSVVVDEAQDMSSQAMKLLRSLVKEGRDDIFIVGDGHQRIYGRNKIVLSRCGINIRGRARKLKLNYRTTDEIRSWAVKLLDGKPIDDLDGGLDTNNGYKSLTHGPDPVITGFASDREQSKFLSEYLKSKEKTGVSLNNICVVARENSEIDRIYEDLTRYCIEVEKITADSSDMNKNGMLKIATMHRIKGLEFEEMILVSINEGLVPLDLAIKNKGDPVEERQADLEERCLVYVAITRAKKHAQVLYYGTKSPYLN